MEFRSHQAQDLSTIEALFVSVFTRSESEAEGALVGEAVKGADSQY